MVMRWITLGILVYLCLVVIIPLLIFPGFIRKRRIKISEKTEKIAKKLKGKNKEQTLRNIFKYVKKMYSEERYNFILEARKLFYRRVDKIVDKKQFLPCHVQSLVLITLLIATGQFKKEDMEKKITISRFLKIHEHYWIKVNHETFKVDPFFGILQKV